MWTSYGFFGLVLMFSIVSYTIAQATISNFNNCTSPNGKSGKCINLKTCPKLLSLLQQKPLTQSMINFLQKSQCGYENRDPKVCCESAYNQTNFSMSSGDLDHNPIDVQFHPNLRLLDHRRCGPTTQDKIAVGGGNTTKIDEYPWMALIIYRKSKQPSLKLDFLCGGTIMNKRYILTAAHCVTSLPSTLKLFGVRVGEHNLYMEKDCMYEGTENEYCAEKYQDFLVETYLYHSNFSITTLENDIALIRVNRDIDFGPKNARPICLPIGSAAKHLGRKMYIAGWGLMELKVISPILLKAALPRFPQDECIDIYKKKGLRISSKQLCYGGELDRGACKGDSGGPLMALSIYNGDRRYVQYGIVSYGPRSCSHLENFPGVYTRVDQYLDWILDNMRD